MRAVLLQGVMVLLALAAHVALAGEASPPLIEPQKAAAGRVVYQRFCASCHGAGGEGGPHWEQLNAQGELPSPPHNAEGHTWKHSDAMLYRMVSEGWRDPFNKTQRLTMPAFGGVLPSEEIRNVITYLKTLWTPEQRQFQWEETLVRGAFPPQAQRPPDRTQSSVNPR